jgi:hypothetical protein
VDGLGLDAARRQLAASRRPRATATTRKTTEETVQTTLPERTDQNTPPIAQDDQYGVRPGRTTVLPVLDNDTDADGDVLVAAPASTPAFGSVEPINNGPPCSSPPPRGRPARRAATPWKTAVAAKPPRPSR